MLLSHVLLLQERLLSGGKKGIDVDLLELKFQNCLNREGSLLGMFFFQTMNGVNVSCVGCKN